MKPILFMLLAAVPLLGIAQKPIAPCCGILSLAPPNGVVVRNNITGQTFQFKADALDFANLKTGDAISYESPKETVTFIKGVARAYSISQPDPGIPCCGITNLNVPAPTEPCCTMIGVHDNTTNEDFILQVDKSIARQLKKGQTVYKYGPVDGFKFSSDDGYGPVDGVYGFAAFKLGTGNASLHSYPIKKQDGGSSIGKVDGSNSSTSNQAITNLKKQLADCEEQNRLLNQKLNSGSAAPFENGYESVYLKGHVDNNETLEVIVNGKTVATYHQGFQLYLDGFLRPNATNVITFKFNSGAANSDMELQGKFAGDNNWNAVFNFSPNNNKSESQFELPFAGKKK